MSSNSDVTAVLQNALQTLSGQLQQTQDQAKIDALSDTIDAISDELAATEAKNLGNANYVPSTDAFKQATADGKAFVTSLNNLKNIVAGAATVAGVADQIIKLITTLGL